MRLLQMSSRLLAVRFSLLIFITIVSYAAFTFTIAEWRSKFRKESNDKENESNNAALDRCTAASLRCPSHRPAAYSTTRR